VTSKWSKTSSRIQNDFRNSVRSSPAVSPQEISLGLSTNSDSIQVTNLTMNIAIIPYSIVPGGFDWKLATDSPN
jgi:hypothetical protein